MGREERWEAAEGMLRELVRVLAQADVNTDTAAGVEEWSERAVRAALRLYGDPQAGERAEAPPRAKFGS